MASYSLAKAGYMYVLTAYGLEQKAPRTVFCNKLGMNKVPYNWVHNGYVKEVPVK